MSKKMISVCLLTFIIGCAGGGALAYGNHQKGLEEQSLLASLAQTQDNWEVEQFIRAQEEQRPDGLEESQVATGSRYTGITYNNVSVATAPKEDTNVVNDAKTADTAADTKEKTGLLSSLLCEKEEQGKLQSSDDDTSGMDDGNAGIAAASYEEKTMGRVAIQSGSLNIRDAASIDGAVIGQAYKDETVEILAQDGVWYQVVTGDGLQGYVSSTYIEVVE